MNVTQILFWVLSVLALFSALMMITSKNPVHSVLWLIVTFFSISGHYILLNAQFLAIVNIIVYAGAIMVLFLFVIMLLDLREEARRKFSKFGVATGVISVGAIGGLMIHTLLTSGVGQGRVAQAEGATRPLGAILFTQYLLPFEIVSVLLLVAMVGVILLSKKDLK